MAECVCRWRNNDTGIVIVLILRSYFVDIYITRHTEIGLCFGDHANTTPASSELVSRY